ncbi:hypothetical protein, partial [Spartinivicinus poritis]
MKTFTVSLVVSGLLLGSGMTNVVNAGVKTSVVAEYNVGPSYPNFSGSSATLIQRKNDEGNIVEFRAIVKRGNTAYIKFGSIWIPGGYINSPTKSLNNPLPRRFKLYT